MSDGSSTPQDPQGSPDDVSRMVEHMLEQARANPQMGQMLRAFGMDIDDPAVRAQLEAQLRALGSGGGGFPFPGMPFGAGFQGVPGFPGFGAAASGDSASGNPVGFGADLKGAPGAGLFSAQGADMARKLARQVMSEAGEDSAVTDEDRRRVEDAVRVASLWLDSATEIDMAGVQARAMSRGEWVEQTMDHWERIGDPLAAGVARATSGALRKQLDRFGPEELKALGEEAHIEIGGQTFDLGNFDLSAMLKQVEPMIEQVGKQLFAAQLGQGVGGLAGQLISATEVGLPLMPEGVVALLPANIDVLAEELEVDAEQVRLYLAAREAARVQLFAHASWLGPQIMSAVDDYARNITIDTDAIEEAVRQIDPASLENPEGLQEMLTGKLFEPSQTAGQKAALSRLETLLALAEGWVDVVADRTCRDHLPQTAALGEAVRRRRIGGAAEKAFSQLVGLKLTPRRLRDAANLWAALENAGGPALRDSRWAHPDLAPDAEDLDDILGFVEKVQGGDDTPEDEALEADLDRALQDILGEADKGSGGTTPAPTEGAAPSGDASGGPSAGPAGEDKGTPEGDEPRDER